MNNLIVGIKKFFTNRNTVTVVGVVLAIIVLYVGYNMRINQAITPVTVPYAVELKIWLVQWKFLNQW